MNKHTRDMLDSNQWMIEMPGYVVPPLDLSSLSKREAKNFLVVLIVLIIVVILVIFDAIMTYGGFK